MLNQLLSIVVSHDHKHTYFALDGLRDLMSSGSGMFCTVKTGSAIVAGYTILSWLTLCKISHRLKKVVIGGLCL